MTTLQVKNFAHIHDARIDFGDLTVLVGPQASGKSLILQWFKMAIDSGEVVTALREAGHDVKEPDAIVDLVFGEGMSSAWDADSTSVQFDGKDVRPAAWARGTPRERDAKVFFIPAHRALLLADGWPAPFLKLNADTPAVARLFSQNLYQRFSGRKAAALFPVQRILKTQYRKLIDDAVFHGGKVELRQENLRYRLGLNYGKKALPFMTWTAGQREFTPLLLGLYHVLPPRKQKKHTKLDWVVIEEPEMGLHPQAVVTFMILVLDLLWRGYRVVLSTHSPLVLDTVWALRRFKENHARTGLVSQAFGVPSTKEIRAVMDHAMQADYRVHYLSIGQKDGKVRSEDISALDPLSDNDGEANWGGLTGFSSRIGEAVRKSVLERDEQ